MPYVSASANGLKIKAWQDGLQVYEGPRSQTGNGIRLLVGYYMQNGLNNLTGWYWVCVGIRVQGNGWASTLCTSMVPAIDVVFLKGLVSS